MSTSKAHREASRIKKEKNFKLEEKNQLCKNVFHINQDLIAAYGEHSNTFWEKFILHYNHLRLEDNLRTWRPKGCY
jgi:hypothetical protein